MLLKVVSALRVLVIADAVLSWVMPADRPPRSFTKALLDPVYAPARRALRPLTGSVDLTPLLALALLFAVQLWLERKRARGAGGG
jgi:uncharacterized protein YggT (Ycf19 family)